MQSQYTRAMSVCIIILALALISLATVPRTATAAEQAVHPPSGPPGTEFAFSATGFESTELVSFWVNRPDGSVRGDPAYVVRPNRDGRAEWTWTAPANAVAGRWSMVAQGLNSGTLRVIAFTVDVMPPPAVHAAGVDPAAGPPGIGFTFFATGFTAGEPVAYWLNTPSGGIIGRPEYVTPTNPDGRADWIWVSSPEAAGGTWEMVAFGVTSGVSHVIPFQIDTVIRASDTST